MANVKQLSNQLDLIVKEGFNVATFKGVSMADGKVSVDLKAMSPQQFDSLAGSLGRCSRAARKCANLIASLQASA